MPATAQQRTDIAKKIAAIFEADNLTGFMDSNDSLDVAQDAYTWLENNVVSLNAALKLIFRNNASTKLKAQLLGIVAEELAKVS